MFESWSTGLHDAVYLCILGTNLALQTGVFFKNTQHWKPGIASLACKQFWNTALPYRTLLQPGSNKNRTFLSLVSKLLAVRDVIGINLSEAYDWASVTCITHWLPQLLEQQPWFCRRQLWDVTDWTVWSLCWTSHHQWEHCGEYVNWLHS